MTLQRYHSRVFVAWKAVHDLLADASWEAADRGGGTPKVAFGDHPEPDNEREVIGVVPVVDDDDLEWVQMGASSRIERFSLDIVYRCRIPGMTVENVIDRMEEIADTVQDLFYDTTTAAFTPPDFDGVTALGGVAAVEPTVTPDGEGWFGDMTIRLNVEARV